MKFLADMGISPRVVEELRKKQHDAVHLIEEGLKSLPDGDVLQKARQENRILLTHDLDFGELLTDVTQASPSSLALPPKGEGNPLSLRERVRVRVRKVNYS